MFLFILAITTLSPYTPSIQIHPMFLFIESKLAGKAAFNSFKYILCSYLSYFLQLLNLLFKIQIHPMFLFISRHVYVRLCGHVFKYILCSYLSTAFTPLRNTIIFLNPLFYKSPAIFPRR